MSLWRIELPTDVMDHVRHLDNTSLNSAAAIAQIPVMAPLSKRARKQERERNKLFGPDAQRHGPETERLPLRLISPNRAGDGPAKGRERGRKQLVLNIERQRDDAERSLLQEVSPDMLRPPDASHTNNAHQLNEPYPHWMYLLRPTMLK